MEIFYLTVDAMLMMFLLIIAGFILQRTKILPEGSDITLARLETYIMVPALNFYTWSSNCTVSAFKENSNLILWGIIVTAVAVSLGSLLCKVFVPDVPDDKKAYQRNIYKYAMTFGNFGFMGNFLVLGIWGSEGLFKYSMFTLAMTFAVASWGVYILVPKTSKPSFGTMVKNFFSPPTIGLILGCLAGLLGLTQYIPDFIMRAASNASNCMGPVSMILAGFVIGSYNFKKLITNKKVYVASLFRLILLPTLFILLLQALHVNKEIITWALIACATPLGLNTIVYPATFGGDTQTGASMALISHTVSVITIPLMYFIFIVLL